MKLRDALVAPEKNGLLFAGHFHFDKNLKVSLESPSESQTIEQIIDLLLVCHYISLVGRINLRTVK